MNTAARPSWKWERTSSTPGEGLGQRLIEVHNHIREETAKLLAAVAEVVAGREPAETAQAALKALSLRQNYPGLGGFCTGYCELLTIHHTLEDSRVFPGLASAYPALKPVLKQLYDEHEVVAELIRHLDQGLSVQGGEDLQHLQAVAQNLAVQLLSHLDYEESQLVEVLNG